MKAQLYFRSGCAYCETFLLLKEKIEPACEFVPVDAVDDWKEITPNKSVPFFVGEVKSAYDTRSIIEVLLRQDEAIQRNDINAVMAVFDLWFSNILPFWRDRIISKADSRLSWEKLEDTLFNLRLSIVRLQRPSLTYALAIIAPFFVRIMFYESVDRTVDPLLEGEIESTLKNEFSSLFETVIGFEEYAARIRSSWL